MSVALSASGEGLSPTSSSLARMNRSTSFFGHDESETSGISGRLGATNAQCSDQGAPSSIQRLIRSFSCWLTFRCGTDNGGMTSLGSALMIRW
jgi:hypothetical protein